MRPDDLARLTRRLRATLVSLALGALDHPAAPAAPTPVLRHLVAARQTGGAPVGAALRPAIAAAVHRFFDAGASDIDAFVEGLLAPPPPPPPEPALASTRAATTAAVDDAAAAPETREVTPPPPPAVLLEAGGNEAAVPMDEDEPPAATMLNA